MAKEKAFEIRDLDEREVFRLILDHFGLKPQLIVTMEECSELIKACSKYLRSQLSPEIDESKAIIGIAEEIADVEIMTSQLKYFLQIGDLVNTNKRLKLMKITSHIINSRCG